MHGAPVSEKSLKWAIDSKETIKIRAWSGFHLKQVQYLKKYTFLRSTPPDKES